MKSLTRGNFKAGIDSVRSAKLRSFWTMMGVIIGVSSVIIILSIGEGIKQQVGGQIHSYGKDIITVRPAQLRTVNDSGNQSVNQIAGLNVSAPLTTADYHLISKTKGVAASAPLTIVTGTVKADYGKYTKGFVIGTTPDLPGLLNQSLSYGSFLTDNSEGQKTAVLGPGAVRSMFDENVPLGRSFEFHGERFVVIGIFNQFAITTLSQQADYNNAIFIPNDVAQELSNNTSPTYSILVRPNDANKAESVAKNVKRNLDRSHGGQSDIEVLSGGESQSSSDTILSLLTRSIAGIAAISLLVGGIGIMNVMLVSVTERMHEIGIRKAIGATNKQIWSQFMIESSLLTLVGGVIGIILAVLVDIGLMLATNLKPAISWQIVTIATLVSLLVGVVFGTVPAFKAARKDPIEALRGN